MPNHAAVWRCTCGRQVPARFDVCHCGVSRPQVEGWAAAEAAENAPKPLNLWGVALRAGAAATAIALVWVWIDVARPFSSDPTPPPPASTLAAIATPPPTTVPPATMRSWQPEMDVNPYVPPPRPQPPIRESRSQYGERASEETATPPPPVDDGPSEMDLLRAKTEMWRQRYRPVAERIAMLEREIPQLQAQVDRAGSVPLDDDNPQRNVQIQMASESAHRRLEMARRELEQARRELREIEDAAMRDGVPSGQLY